MSSIQASPFAFPFIGALDGPSTCTLTIVGQNPNGRITGTAIQAAAPMCRLIVPQPGVLHIGWRQGVSQEEVDATLRAFANDAGAVGLVIRKERVTPWRDVLARPALFDDLLRVLETHVKARTAYNTPPLRTPVTLKPGVTTHDAAIKRALVSDRSLPWVPLLFRVMRRVTKGQQRKDWFATLDARLPQLMGHSFVHDLLLVAELVAIRQVSAFSIPTSPAFEAAMAHAWRGQNRVASADANAHWHEPQHLERVVMGEAAASVLRAIDGSFDEDNAAHQQTLLALSPQARLRLCTIGQLHIRLANVATRLTVSGRFADALRLYDALLAADVDHHPDTLANPLYAVADDNNHLGINPSRAHAYLKVALPYGDRNPLIFLNAAGLYAELLDGENTIHCLEQARAGGVQVNKYRNDKPFAWLKTHDDFGPRFARVMR